MLWKIMCIVLVVPVVLVQRELLIHSLLKVIVNVHDSWWKYSIRRGKTSRLSCRQWFLVFKEEVEADGAEEAVEVAAVVVAGALDEGTWEAVVPLEEAVDGLEVVEAEDEALEAVERVADGEDRLL
jgi:hypothetical protein